MGGKNIFGTINEVQPKAITVALLLVILVIIIIDFVMTKLKKIAEKYYAEEIFNKLVYELMILGWISFAIFITNITAVNNKDVINSEYFIAFGTADLTVFFIALCFIVEAVILVIFSSGDGINFLIMVRTTDEELHDEFKNATMKSINSPNKNETTNNESSISDKRDITNLVKYLSPNFFTKIEFKLMQTLFIQCHGFPVSFDFGSYMGYALSKFIAHVGETSAALWFSLGIVLVMNYVRTLIDNSAETRECRNEPLNQLWGCGGSCATDNGGHRLLAGETTNVYVSPDMHCYSYFFSYAFLCSIALNFSIYGVYYASCYYESATAFKAIEVIFPNKNILETLKSTKNNNNSKWLSYIIPSSFDSNHELCIAALQEIVKQKQIIKEYTIVDKIRLSNVVNKRQHHKNQNEQKKLLLREASKKWNMFTLFNIFKIFDKSNEMSVKGSLKKSNPDSNSDTNPEIEIDMSDIFWMQQPKLFFFFLKFIVLLQSFYLAIYFTQLLPLAVESKNPGWGMALTITPIIGGYIIFLTLRRSALLHAMTKLDFQLAGKVIEEMKTVKSLKEEICGKIYEVFTNEDLNSDKDKMIFIKKHLDPDDSNTVDRAEFLLFLDEIKIYISKDHFELLWKLIDYDLSGTVTVDEILVFLFPNMKTTLQNEMKLVESIRKKFQNMFHKQNISNNKTVEFLQKKFQLYDEDGSGAIDPHELRNMIDSLDIKIDNDHDFDLLLAATEVNCDGDIEFNAFKNLVLSPYEQSFSVTTPNANMNAINQSVCGHEDMI